MSAPDEFTIRVSNLDAGGKLYEFAVRSSWIRGVLEGHEATATKHEGALSVRASKSGHDVVVRGTLDAELSVPCARCLESIALPIHAELSVLYMPGVKLKADGDAQIAGAQAEAEYVLTDAEADTLPFDGETVVLDDLVRDELVLGVPMIPLCSEACPGMSRAPGSEGETPSAAKDVDPRLAPLLQFRAKTTKA